jgi:hypothetical protein
MIPQYHAIPNIARNSYLKIREIRTVETLCIKAINHKMDFYSPYHFIEFFVHVGYTFDAENVSRLNMSIFDNFKMFVKDEKIIEFTPLEIASACIMMTLDKNGKDFLDLYDINESDYKTCLDYLKG